MSIDPAARPKFSGNLFLDALPAESYGRIASKLERLTVQIATPVVKTGARTEHVWFPVSGVVSAVQMMQGGGSVEVMLVGREGFYGVQAALGAVTSSNDAMIQLPGSVLRMLSSDFATLVDDDADLSRHVLRYVQCTLDSVAQFSACNRLHPVDERCARWLLMAHDRVTGDDIFLTQEYLSMMLGVRRPSVSIAASSMEHAGYIKYSRGRIVMMNRVGLEAATCECYDAANASLQRNLGYGISKSAEAPQLNPSGLR